MLRAACRARSTEQTALAHYAHLYTARAGRQRNADRQPVGVKEVDTKRCHGRQAWRLPAVYQARYATSPGTAGKHAPCGSPRPSPAGCAHAQLVGQTNVHSTPQRCCRLQPDCPTQQTRRCVIVLRGGHPTVWFRVRLRHTPPTVFWIHCLSLNRSWPICWCAAIGAHDLIDHSAE